MPEIAWINGVTKPKEQATVAVDDHAHLYGDGIFEGIRFYDRKVFKLDEHLERLYHGIAYMGYKVEMCRCELKRTILSVCAEANLDNGYIRLNVTRGSALGLDPKNCDKANVVILISKLSLYPPEAYRKGLNVITSAIRVIPADILDPRLKCIGRYAANILAKMQGNLAGAGEVLLLNASGQVAECAGDNVFLIEGKRVRTPHPSSGILAGITRETVMHLAGEAGYEVSEDFLTPFDFFRADEAFLTGTAAEVVPVITLDGRSIGRGEPGPVTLDLMQRFREATQTGTEF